MGEAQYSDQLSSKRLATGEIAIWDGSKRVVYIINDKQETLKVVRGSTLKEIERMLGDVVVLV